ncbi:hypothetical protein [Phenylobacterium sp.]|uniref:hypothetical protein n=1 Tax=Phenylobacterium sp. TaxID=1871053 RepID=UPI00286B9E28|nr:hypothetical protein [Phenylobacterium sp.]
MARTSRPWATQRRLLIAAFSVAGHLAAVFALLSAQTFPPRVIEAEPMVVRLVDPPRPPIAAAPEAPTPVEAVAPTPPPPRNIVRRTAARADLRPEPASQRPTTFGAAEVSDAELALAGTAETGGAGGGCNMARWLQAALRKDRRVQAAVADTAQASGPRRAIRVWNGDWVRHAGQEGNGLAAVREAIMWEVAFAPVACRTEPVRGLVQLSLADGPGGSRLVVGSDTWRWSDLLLPH